MDTLFSNHITNGDVTDSDEINLDYVEFEIKYLKEILMIKIETKS